MCFAAAGFLVVVALFRLLSSQVAPCINKQREQILSLADLAGIGIGIPLASFLAMAGPAVCVILHTIHRRRMSKIDNQLPDALALLGNALRAGLSLPQAMEMAAVEMKPPLGDELLRSISQLKLGRTVEEALAVLSARVPTEDVTLLVQSVEVLRRTGGNIAQAFAALAGTIEGRLKVTNRIRVLTAQGIYQGIMLLAMPWALCVLLHLIAPEYTEPLFKTRLGNLFVGFGILLEVAGALWLKRIVLIRA